MPAQHLSRRPQHVEPNNAENIIGFGSDLTVLSNSIYNASVPIGHGQIVSLRNSTRIGDGSANGYTAPQVRPDDARGLVHGLLCTSL